MRGESPALWILSKISMLFFIISLAAILMIASSQWSSDLCYTQALTLSRTVSSSISDLLNSPLEDQRSVVSLPYSITVGNGIDSRYILNISELNTGSTTNPNNLVVGVFSEYDPSCKASVLVPFDSSQFNLELEGQRLYSNPTADILQTLEFLPSLQQTSINSVSGQTSSRSTFVSIVKCQSKTPAKTKYLFIEDCTHKSSLNCIDISSGDSSYVSANSGQTSPQVSCGYNNGQTSNT